MIQSAQAITPLDLGLVRAPRDCYIYAWFSGREVVYIGKGTGARFLIAHWVSTDGMRKAKQISPKDIESFSFMILSEGLDEKLAFRVERDLIKLTRPRFNVIKQKRPGRPRGKSYATQHKEAKAIGEDWVRRIRRGPLV